MILGYNSEWEIGRSGFWALFMTDIFCIVNRATSVYFDYKLKDVIYAYKVKVGNVDIV